MDIPSLSMALAQTKLQSDVGVAMLSKSLDMASETGGNIAEMLEVSVPATPYIGGSIDVSV